VPSLVEDAAEEVISPDAADPTEGE